jgi:hypothetical protein
MYWCNVKCDSTVKAGDILTFDSATQLWAKASSLVTPLGVAREDAVQREGQDYYFTPMVQWGSCTAKASRDIPDEGGELNVENGAVYVDNTADGCGIIVPNNIDYPSRVAGGLVTIIIR